MTENPFKVVVDALAAQTAAIGTLASEIQTEFDQYQTAVAAQDNIQATLIAAAINERTAALVTMASALEASVPGQGASIGNPITLPGPGDMTKPTQPDEGHIDNTLPGDIPVVGGGPIIPPGVPVEPGTPTNPIVIPPGNPGDHVDNTLPEEPDKPAPGKPSQLPSWDRR